MSIGYKENYRKIWIDHYGNIPIDEDGRTYDIHHIDGDKSNNKIENLIALAIQDHFEIHYKQGNFEACKAISMRMENHDFKGYKLSERTRQKLSESKKGDKNPTKRKDVAEKISRSLTGRKKSIESEIKRIKSREGYKHSEQTILKMKKPKTKLECPNCKKLGGSSQMKRWHFNNCKLLKK